MSFHSLGCFATLLLPLLVSVQETSVPVEKPTLRLESIGFKDCHIDAKALRAIARLESLQSLSLGNCWRIDDDDLKPLAARTELRALDLHGCRKLTGRFVEYLGGMEHLRWLDLARCSSIEGRVLEQLEKFRELETLNLHGMCGLTKERLRVLSSLPRLKTLSVMWCREFDDAALLELSAAESLEEIRVYRTPVTGEGIAAFREARAGILRRIGPPSCVRNEGDPQRWADLPWFCSDLVRR